MGAFSSSSTSPSLFSPSFCSFRKREGENWPETWRESERESFFKSFVLFSLLNLSRQVLSSPFLSFFYDTKVVWQQQMGGKNVTKKSPQVFLSGERVFKWCEELIVVCC